MIKTIRRAPTLLLIALSAIATSDPALAQRPMKIVDLLNIPWVSDPQLSPDGRQLVYVRSDADWAANKHVGHIWRINLDGTGEVQLTTGTAGEGSPRFSPDGKWIAFLATRATGQPQQIFLIGSTGGEARRLGNHPTAASSIAWSRDGESIYFLAEGEKTAEEAEREKAKDDAIAFDETGKNRHLWTMAVGTGKSMRLTDGDFTVLSYNLAQDGKHIVYHRAPGRLLDDLEDSEVWLMSSSGTDQIQLTKNSVTESGASLSPDNSQVLFLSGTNDRFEPYFNEKLFLVPAAGGAPRRLLGEMQHAIVAACWSNDGKAIFVLANTGVRSELFRVDPTTGKSDQLTSGDHEVRDWRYQPATGQHVFAIDEPSNPGDIWVLGSAAATPVRVTHVFDYVARDFKLPRQEAIGWTGKDGTTVEGLLYYPADYVPGRRYPLAVSTHGGPAASDKFGFGIPAIYWVNDHAVLTGLGYAVLKPNYRGSTGYGDAFLRDMVGHYFQNAHLDVLAGVDKVVSMGIADPDRLVKMGWSGGGHMTNKLITYTDRFKAAASGAGASNWISMYSESDNRRGRTAWFGGTPWQKDAPIEVYWESSPLKYASKVKTPTIFLVGASDLRVPPPQSVEMYRALKSNRVPTHLYLFPREPHVLGELRHQLFKINVELDWFEKYARGQKYSWESGPRDAATP
ncbi:MAG: S9 family peptidase [Gemmatimonadota bacterium]